VVLPSPDRLAEIAYQATVTFADGLGPRSRTIWDAMLARRIEVSGGAPDYLHSFAQPIVRAPLWAAQAVAASGGAVHKAMVETAVAAGAVGYYAVRLQDDLVDESIGDPGAIAVLSSAVLATAQSTLGSIGLSAGFWRWHSGVMLRYAEAMQFEAEVRTNPDGYEEDAFDQVLERSRPLVVPGVAILDATDAWPLRPDFEQMVMAATSALQLINDLGHAAKDISAGNRTWVHTLLGVRGDSPLTRGRLIGGMDRVFDQIKYRLEHVVDLGRGLGVPDAAAWAETTERAAAERFERLLVWLLETPPGGPPA
jgi:hypothetical protein